MLGLHRRHRHARASTAAARTVPATERDLVVRLTREFHEMPGLCLTPAQAARLCSADEALTARVLESLVGAGVLWRDRRLYRAVCAHRQCA